MCSHTDARFAVPNTKGDMSKVASTFTFLRRYLGGDASLAVLEGGGGAQYKSNFQSPMHAAPGIQIRHDEARDAGNLQHTIQVDGLRQLLDRLPAHGRAGVVRAGEAGQHELRAGGGSAGKRFVVEAETDIAGKQRTRGVTP
jgi:hypothetical protein